MDSVLLLVMATSGLLRVVLSHDGRQYHFVSELKNMTEAQSYCREKYTDVATIDNMEDVRMLTNLTDFKQPAWIGLIQSDRNSWRWSLADQTFYRGGEAEFRDWHPGAPDDVESAEYCVTRLETGRWNDDRCGKNYSSVCMDVRGPNVIFVLNNNPMTWTEAQSYCRKHHTDLASVRNAAENQMVNQLVPHGKIAWIGLFRDSWKWSDGSNSSFRYWNSGEPDNYGGNESCVAAVPNSGRMSDLDCALRKAFICHGPPKTKRHVFKVRLQKDSSLDLNNPAVLEELLKQLKQDLKQQGVNEDVKLSWRKQPDGKVFHKEEEEEKKKIASNEEL